LSDSTALLQVTSQSFRDAMAKLASAINIVTTDGPAGRAGFTASAVCSVTDAPASLLVCLNRSASVYEAVRTNGVLGVNTLGPDHRSLSALFGGKTPLNERFAAARWFTGETGAPLLEGAVVNFDCRIAQVTDVGSHTILICEIVGLGGIERDDALVYFNRAYHTLGPASAS
jgi:flavin reductase